MTLEDLRKLPTLQTATVAEVVKRDESTFFYIIKCLNRFFTGDYGDISEEDTAANNADLKAGSGHILARYGQAYELETDIYIEAHFEEGFEGVDYNNIVIMYPSER